MASSTGRHQCGRQPGRDCPASAVRRHPCATGGCQAAGPIADGVFHVLGATAMLVCRANAAGAALAGPEWAAAAGNGGHTAGLAAATCMTASCGTSCWAEVRCGPGDQQPSRSMSPASAWSAVVLLAGLLQLRAVGLPARPPASRQDPPQKTGDRYGYEPDRQRGGRHRRLQRDRPGDRARLRRAGSAGGAGRTTR